MANSVDYLFLVTCDLCFPSGEVSLQVFAHFLIELWVGLFVFLPLRVLEYINILDSSLLLDMWTANILSQTEAYFLLAFIEQSFKF